MTKTTVSIETLLSFSEQIVTDSKYLDLLKPYMGDQLVEAIATIGNNSSAVRPFFRLQQPVREALDLLTEAFTITPTIELPVPTEVDPEPVALDTPPEDVN